MKRSFTQDLPPRYKDGDIRDYPMPTWTQIGDGVGMKVDQFSRPEVEATRVPRERPLKGGRHDNS